MGTGDAGTADVVPRISSVESHSPVRGEAGSSSLQPLECCKADLQHRTPLDPCHERWQKRRKRIESNQALDASRSGTETQSNTSSRTWVENIVVTAFHRKREKDAGVITSTARPVQTLPSPRFGDLWSVIPATAEHKLLSAKGTGIVSGKLSHK